MIHETIDTTSSFIGTIYDMMVAGKEISFVCDETTDILLALNEIDYNHCVIIAMNTCKLLDCLWGLLIKYNINGIHFVMAHPLMYTMPLFYKQVSLWGCKRCKFCRQILKMQNKFRQISKMQNNKVAHLTVYIEQIKLI